MRKTHISRKKKYVLWFFFFFLVIALAIKGLIMTFQWQPPTFTIYMIGGAIIVIIFAIYCIVKIWNIKIWS